jgi:5-formyltetrahydrofolate cyclo-ligase
MPAPSKSTLRAERLAALKVSPATAGESAAIAARVISLPAFAEAKCVALYAPLQGEPDPSPVWLAAAEKQIVCPGAGEDGSPELRVAQSLAAMARTARGFAEPPPGARVDPSKVDLWIVPGLAFDAAGVRLGRGGGYYDRLLGKRRPDSLAVGVILEWFRSLFLLPREPHDALIDLVATERALHETV